MVDRGGKHLQRLSAKQRGRPRIEATARGPSGRSPRAAPPTRSRAPQARSVRRRWRPGHPAVAAAPRRRATCEGRPPAEATRYVPIASRACRRRRPAESALQLREDRTGVQARVHPHHRHAGPLESPAAIACWTGEAPRHRGTARNAGSPRRRGPWSASRSPRISPYATTTMASGRAAASASAPGPRRTPAASTSGTPRRRAASATAVGRRVSPRPAAFGGFVTTSATARSGSPAIASRAGTDHGSLPRNAIRTVTAAG